MVLQTGGRPRSGRADPPHRRDGRVCGRSVRAPAERLLCPAVDVAGAFVLAGRFRTDRAVSTTPSHLLVALALASVAILRALEALEKGGVPRRATNVILIVLCVLGTATNSYVYFEEVRVEECNLHLQHTEIAEYVSKHMGEAYLYAYASSDTDRWTLEDYISLFAFQKIRGLGQSGMALGDLVTVVEMPALRDALADPRSLNGKTRVVASQQDSGDWEDPPAFCARRWWAAIGSFGDREGWISGSGTEATKKGGTAGALVRPCNRNIRTLAAPEHQEGETEQGGESQYFGNRFREVVRAVGVGPARVRLRPTTCCSQRTRDRTGLSRSTSFAAGTRWLRCLPARLAWPSPELDSFTLGSESKYSWRRCHRGGSADWASSFETVRDAALRVPWHSGAPEPDERHLRGQARALGRCVRAHRPRVERATIGRTAWRIGRRKVADCVGGPGTGCGGRRIRPTLVGAVSTAPGDAQDTSATIPQEVHLSLEQLSDDEAAGLCLGRSRAP